MYLDRPIPLRSSHRPNRRRGGPKARGGSVIVVAVLLLVNYFVFFRGEDPANSDLANLPGQGAVAGVGVAPATRGAAGAPGPGDDALPYEVDDFGQPVGRKLVGEIKRGQTILNAMRVIGIDGHTAQPIIAAMSSGKPPVFDFRYARAGDTFTANVDDDGQITYFVYTQSPLDVYEVIRAADGTYTARKKSVPKRTEIAHLGCALKSSLYESIARCGEGPELAGKLIDIFAWDVDFFLDVKEGDEFKVIVEKISVEGRFIEYGRVLAAQYRGKFGEQRIVSFRDPEGREGFYKPDGHSVSKEFIKSPLKYTAVVADAGEKQRPSIKTASPVIYSARANTPVWAVAGGTVVVAGDTGGALGKTVTIKHDNGFTSTYAHLGSISSGIKPGSLVNQKTVIGKVGSSGDADSPQLLFSLRKDGKLQNPLKVSFSEGEPVAPEHKSRFDAEVKLLIEDLEAIQVIAIQQRRN